MSNNRKLVVILQPYIPAYRVKFFSALIEKADRVGVDVVVAAGQATGAQAKRNDGAAPAFAVPFQQREVRILGRRLTMRRLPRAARTADLVIMEQARRNIDAYKLLLPGPLRGRSIALWGHGADYAGSKGRLDSLVRKALTRRAEWFFGYTAAGVASVHQQGLPAARSTEVRNSTDTRELKLHIEESLGSSLKDFKQKFELGQFTAAYLGALDEGKRLDVLIAAGHEVWQAIPTFKLLVAGDGPARELVEGADARYPWLTYLGPVAGKAKAHVLASSSLLMVPGSIGLVAVDALAAGVPIITTSNNPHGPEFDYLVPGETSIVTPPLVEQYAQAVIALYSNPTNLLRLQENCRAAGSEFSIDNMAANFLGGILEFFDAEVSR